MGAAFEDGLTLLSRFEELVEEDPDKAMFVFWDKNERRTVMSRQEIWDTGRKFAAVLHRLGVRKGDIVCDTLINSPERLITCFGAMFAGAISMHGQMFLADGADIMKTWTDSRCKIVIVDAKQEKGAAAILERLKYKDDKTGEFAYKDLPHLCHVIPVVLKTGENDVTGSWLKSLDKETVTFVDNTVAEDDLAYVFATSGSTGFAKLVPHTHKNLMHLTKTTAQLFELLPESVYYNHRSFGWVGGFPFLVIWGITRVVIDQTFGMPGEMGKVMLKIFDRENVDCSFLLPSDIQNILNALNSGQNINRQLRLLITGGGPVSKVTLSALGCFTDSLRLVYGSTECGLLFKLIITDPELYQNSCAGYPADGVEAKILGDDMEELPHGEVGEIFLRSPTIANEYLHNAEKTKEVFLEDGWFRTSDIGRFDAQGQLFVYCRTNNAINHKGFLHYPGWMENRINVHELIQKSMVVGIPDPVNHEEICLCIIKSSPQAELSQEDVHEFCKSLFLTSEKEQITPIPKHYLFFDRFPLNTNGKIDRKALRDAVLRRLDL